jgi:PTH1 family peptidyl-tRNA hydrolase
MKIIVGLGNLGEKYENTRHNSGFMFVDKLRDYLGWDKQYDASDWKKDKKFQAEICEVRAGSDKKFLLVKPTTFMNKSGIAVSKIASMYKTDVDKDLIVVHDDLDIELGKYKIQKSISPKLHNGLKSVEDLLGKRDFLRVRMGVDNRKHVSDVPGDEYVLMKMKDNELEILKHAIDLAIRDLRDILSA